MDKNFSLRGKSLVRAEYLSLLSVQGQFGDLVSTCDLNIQGSLYCQLYTLLVYFYVASDQAERQGPWASCYFFAFTILFVLRCL